MKEVQLAGQGQPLTKLELAQEFNLAQTDIKCFDNTYGVQELTSILPNTYSKLYMVTRWIFFQFFFQRYYNAYVN